MQLDADIPCPKCNRKLKVKLADMREGRSRRCSFCGAEIAFKGDGGPKAQKAIDDLTKSFKKLDLKIKL